jgi:hypothetical protein
MAQKQRNRLEYLRPELFDVLGFARTGNDDLSWTHPELLPYNLTLVDFGNGSWHFHQRGATNGIGKMVWLDDLLKGFEFVTGKKLIQ